MFSEYRRPRWGWLYLVLPLAVILFWLAERAHTSITVHRLLEVGVMLVVWAYVEIWQRLNLTALLHHPFFHSGAVPFYREREAVPPKATRAPIGTFYSDLFATSINVWNSEPSTAGEPERSGPIVVTTGASTAAAPAALAEEPQSHA